MRFWNRQSNVDQQYAQLFEQGHQCVHQGRLAEALPLFEQCVALQPKNGEAWSYYGWVLLDLHRLDEAIVALDNATKYAPKNVAAWYNKGLALRQIGRIREAAISNNRALELKPDSALAWYQKGLILSGEAHAEQIEQIDKQHFEAFEAFSQAAMLQPDNAATWLRRGRLAWRLAHSVQVRERLGIDMNPHWHEYLDAALTSFDRVLDHVPDDPATLFDKGRALADFGYDVEARDVYRRLTHVADHPNDWYQLALVNSRLGDTAELRASLARALALDPARRADAAGDFENDRDDPDIQQLLDG